MRAVGSIVWAQAGSLTAIDTDVTDSLAGLGDDPVGVCRTAQGLVMLPDLAAGFGIPENRQDERSIRSASDVLRRLLALDGSPLVEAREPDRRVVGTCRHFALLSCAFLRHRGIAARVRCGFAGYFEARRWLDHWVTEYLDDTGRWVRIDSEILGFDYVDRPEDLAAGEFLTGGEAWTFLRETGVDPMHFGVDGAPHAWGIGEVRGNAIRDLAALNKVEMLPWDEWGRMDASYKGETGEEFDALITHVAEACASNDESTIRQTYLHEDLAVPEALLA
ncbi:MAG: transglutaminase-like domain-containing protein [Acidimicrobiales bacterium]